jgi:hypothetical protein
MHSALRSSRLCCAARLDRCKWARNGDDLGRLGESLFSQERTLTGGLYEGPAWLATLGGVVAIGCFAHAKHMTAFLQFEYCVPESQALADLYGAQHDLEEAIRYCDLHIEIDPTESGISIEEVSRRNFTRNASAMAAVLAVAFAPA